MLAALCCFTIPLFSQTQSLVPAYPNLTFVRLMDIQAPPDGSDRLFTVEKDGIIRILPLDSEATEAPVFLDIQNAVITSGDFGLQSIAFHPEFATNGYFFVHYSRSGPNRSVISRFQRSASNPEIADPQSELVLLEVNQPATNHNGGQILFGPDGYLYIPFGDGGSQHDPDEHGQDLTTLLSAILRIDVDNPNEGLNYGIPEDNPFVGNLEGYREEIYAYGFREPWKSSFGPNGKFWVADVGQDDREEVNWVTLGGNYGWDVAEGELCHEPSVGCDMGGMQAPAWHYSHSDGSSITGGYVYSNAEDGCFELLDKYIFADYVSNAVWAVTYDDQAVTNHETLLPNAGISISTFGIDNNGTVYMSSYGGSSTIHKFACSNEPPLPVELTSFDAVGNGSSVHLNWETASELNNAGFEVQIKAAGKDHFEAITFIDGAGTTNEPQSYSHTVANVIPGAYQFRLKQIDFDGTFAFSDIAEVQLAISETHSISPLHPNPFNPTTQFTLAVRNTQQVQIDVYDLSGRHIQRLFVGLMTPDGNQQVVWDADATPSGVYYIRIKGEQFLDSRRAVLVK